MEKLKKNKIGALDKIKPNAMYDVRCAMYDALYSVCMAYNEC